MDTKEQGSCQFGNDDIKTGQLTGVAGEPNITAFEGWVFS